MRLRTLTLLALLLSTLPSSRSVAQVPPSPEDIAAYQGLHRAAHSGDVLEIRRLLASGADPDLRDSRQRTPLHVACHARKGEAMKALVAGRANPRAVEYQNYDCITVAAVADDVPTLRIAIEIGGNPRQVTSPYQGTALIAAAHLGHEGVVKTLIEAGAPLDHVNNLGWTALIEAVILGNGGPRHIETVRLLVQAGARRDLADREGRSPLDHARSRGYAAMIALLEK
jgi:ankyrin repeat protein